MTEKKIVKVIETVFFTDGTQKTVVCEGDDVGTGVWRILHEAEANEIRTRSTVDVDQTYVPPIYPPYPYQEPYVYTYPQRTLDDIYNLLCQILQELRRDGCCKKESLTVEGGELSSKDSSTD
jgi:hypothetical protein